MSTYTYQIVEGASVYGRPQSIQMAKEGADKIARQYGGAPVEVERVLELPYGARRYWRWRSGKWVLTSDDRYYSPSATDLQRWRLNDNLNDRAPRRAL